MLANVVVDLFLKGGPIMYPIAVVTLFAICIFIERVFWWLRFTAKRSVKQLDEVYEKLEAGNLAQAITQAASAINSLTTPRHKPSTRDKTMMPMTT